MNGNTIFALIRTQTGIPRPALWIDLAVPRILVLAVRGAPEPLRERLAEEWSADLAQQHGSAARLRFALGCCWAALVIRHEAPRPSPVAVVSSPAATGGSIPGYRGRSVATPLRASSANVSVMSEINITPLIDVMLVLLVTLIISLPTMTHAVKLNLPQGVLSLQEHPPTVIDLDIDADGTIVWNGTALTGLQQLEAYLQAEAQTDPQAEIHLWPERRAKYDVVAKVLAAAQRSRFEKMAFANTSEFAK